MENYTEVRWHGRAQQGMVTAAKILGEACLRAGKFVQAFPEFGPERMGAPVKAYNRVSSEPIRMHCQVTSPRLVLIADPTLIGMALSGGLDASAGVTDGATEDAIYLVNTPKSPAQMRKDLELVGKKAKVYTVDASTISLETIGRFMPNTPMLGALAKISGLTTLSDLVENFRDNYSKKFSPKVIEGNVAAMNRGYEEVKGD